MTCTQETTYDWNTLRKLWHFAGCGISVVLFYEWKSVQSPFQGSDLLLMFGWLATAGAVGIDIVRFASPKNNAALEAHPVYGKMLRPQERHHFNASTYLVLAATILVTLWYFELCHDSTVMVSIAVLGIADPAAAAMRHVAARWGFRGPRAYGVFAFVLAGTGVTWTLFRWQGVVLGLFPMAAMVLVVGLLEAHTGWGVRLVSPLTGRLHALVPQPTRKWLVRFYPDDNLLIPLSMAGLIEWWGIVTG